MRISRRGGRVRLRSASSQLPDGTKSSWFQLRCTNIRSIAHYLTLLIVICIILSLNNLVLIYLQQTQQGGYVDKLPTTDKTGVDVRVELPKEANKTHHNPKSSPKISEHPLQETENFGTLVKRAPAISTPAPATKKPVDQEPQRRFEDGEDKTTPNELLQQAVIVLINTKSSCQIHEVVGSFQHDYADIPILVEESENTREFCSEISQTSSDRPTCVSAESCKSAKGCSHNQLTQSIIDKLGDGAYVFVWDAQYLYTETHTLALLAKHFVESRVKILAPCVSDYCNSTTGSLHYSKKSGELTALPGIYIPSNLSFSASSCHLTDIFPPVFLTTRKTLTTQIWNERENLGEHTELMLNVQRRKLAVAVCKDVEVTYSSSCESDKGILADRWLTLSAIAFKKWNITKIYNGLGRSYEPVKGKVQFSDADWTPVDQAAFISNRTFGYWLQQVVIQHINDQSPGWEYIRSVSNSTSTKLAYMYTSPCILRIKGSVQAEYDRHPSFRNKQTLLDVDMYHLNRSCHMFKDYWRITQFGKLKRRQVYYVTAVSNDSEYMERLLLMINSQEHLQYINLVIVDMGSPGQEQFNMSKYGHLKLDTHYLHLGAPFSRSIGLKKGFESVLKTAAFRGHIDPIIFAIDTSMVIPQDFTHRVWKSTRCGVSTYAPICYKEKDGGGYWSQFGYGMIGACASDYTASGGWDSKWGYHWGAEDVDFVHRIQEQIPYTVRVKEGDYKHSHSEEHRKTSKYYNPKNVYPGALPITPLTKNVTDASLIDVLKIYAIKRMKYRIELELKAVYETALSQTSGILYDLRFKNNHNEDYYALIQSV